MKSDEKMQKNDRIRKGIRVTLNVLIVVFTISGTYAMLTFKGKGSGLSSSGIENLRYFTVLSNEFCGVIAVLWLLFCLRGKSFPVLPKLMAAAAVGLTFLIIAAFLAPMYPELNLYEGGNFWFHLIVPLTGMLEFIVLKTNQKIPFRYTLYAAALALIYGIGYLINILINGIGEWPDTNDWYGFLKWGYPVGIGIFAFIVFLNWGMACILRLINLRVNRGNERHRAAE